jgi:hypothetical protein
LGLATEELAIELGLSDGGAKPSSLGLATEELSHRAWA